MVEAGDNITTPSLTPIKDLTIIETPAAHRPYIAMNDIKYCIEILEKTQQQFHKTSILPVIVCLSALGVLIPIIIDAIKLKPDKIVLDNEISAAFFNHQYNNATVPGYEKYSCGEIYPLINVCDYPHKHDSGYLDDMVKKCYRIAQELCAQEGGHYNYGLTLAVDVGLMVLIITAASVLSACLQSEGLGIQKKKHVNDINSELHHDFFLAFNKIKDITKLRISEDTLISTILSKLKEIYISLEKEKIKMTLLSAGLKDENQQPIHDKSALFRFFSKDGDKEITKRIFFHADLLPEKESKNSLKKS